jgi:hypothetical protein
MFHRPRLVFARSLVGACLACSLWGAESDAQAADTIEFELRWEVAEGIHPSADSLGRLSGIAVDQHGVVYVSDVSDSRLWVFDSSGRSVARIGRRGRGPGEFDAPTGVAIGTDGLLYVRDVTHVSRFGPDAVSGRLTRFRDSFRGPALTDWQSARPSRFDAQGRFYYPQFGRVDRSTRSGVFLIYSSAGVLLDSLVVPPFAGAPSSTAWVRTSANGGRMLNGLNHVPFAALPSWDVTPRGTLLLTDGAEYLVRELDSRGVVVREYRGSATPQAIPRAERRDSLDALQARWDSVEAPAAQVLGVPEDVRALRLPTSYPPIMSAYAGTDGSVWVRRWVPGAGHRTVFEVFSPEAELVAVVTLPRFIAVSPAPVLSLSLITAVGIDPDTGAHTVLSFTPTRPR